ncbi:MAG: response regulator [Actinobacteria bacterium]|nr:MAG: response regulator [Actinomycetota bacterium]
MARREFPGRRAPTSEPDWLTLGQAAKYLGVAQSTIRKWSDQGRVPAFYTPGGHRRYRRADLDNFLNRSEVSPDLVLLDVMMPEVDGWEMLRRLQERHGVGAIPVVMFSGKVEEQAAAEATARGAQGFLGKPFDPQQLIEHAKQLLPA